jgi:hypothetical protein
MRCILPCIIVLTAVSAYGQTDSVETVLTKEQNEHWFIRLRQSDLEKQVEKINRRILMDTNVSVFSGVDRLVAEQMSNRRAGYCKPILVVGGTPHLYREQDEDDLP